MRISKILGDYISEKKYSMLFKDNSLNVCNYTEILDFSSTKISVKYEDRVYYIEGSNLVISKMLDNEILITGNINNILFS